MGPRTHLLRSAGHRVCVRTFRAAVVLPANCAPRQKQIFAARENESDDPCQATTKQQQTANNESIVTQPCRTTLNESVLSRVYVLLVYNSDITSAERDNFMCDRFSCV